MTRPVARSTRPGSHAARAWGRDRPRIGPLKSLEIHITATSLGGRFDRLAVNNHMKRERPQPRLLLSTREAVTTLGINLHHFKRHNQAHVGCARNGQLALYPLRNLERWVEDKATINGRAQRR